MALLLIPFSLVADRWGRERLMRFGLLGAALCALASAWAADFSLLVLARALLGACIAGVPAAAMAHLGEELPGHVRARVMGLYIAANALGGRTQGLEKRYPRQVQAINEGLAALKEMEKAYETNPDLPAAAFGGILGEVFVQDGHPLSEALYAFGNQLGRFIYLMDAAVDLKKDIQQERYNPLITVPTERHQQLLELLMADCTRTFSALPILRDRELMENILYSGVWSRFPKRGQGEAQA